MHQAMETTNPIRRNGSSDLTTERHQPLPRAPKVSRNCYALDADLTHHFAEDGSEVVYVDQLKFPNGGYLNFSGATIPGGGTDKNEKEWTFAW